MAPKAKAKGVAKAKAKGKAKARPGRRLRAPGGLRRPAHRGREVRNEDVGAAWTRGDEVVAGQVPLLELGRGVQVVFTSAMYYHQECKVAGAITGMDVVEGETTLRLQLRGTTHEGLLKLHSAGPLEEFRVHLCRQDCNKEEVADYLIHATTMRKMKEDAKEEGWVTNLLKVRPADDVDELGQLRQRQQQLDPERKEEERLKQKKKKEKDKKVKEKDRKEKKIRKEKEELKGGSSSSLKEAALDGTQARLAARKTLMAVFAGTGLDPREKVRRRVASRARTVVKKKRHKSRSSSSSGSSGSSRAHSPEAADEGVFHQESKVRLVAASQPGALACQALSHMRGLLLSEIGSADQPGVVKGCAVAYYRQCLQRKSSGPAQRELFTIAAAVDQAMSGNVAGCLDTLLQRLKSSESTLAGTHWTVSQRLEILPQDHVLLTPLPEMTTARKDVFEETKMKYLASMPEGRNASASGKGGGKGKAEGKDGSKGSGKDRRWGKGGPQKGDTSKKGKEESNPKV